MNIAKKRVTVKPKHANPLFEQWLTEWRDKAVENNSKMQHCFTQALSTLRKYPLPLESGRDCKILKGFGEKLCKMLDEKLRQHRAESVRQNTEIKESVKNTVPEYVPRRGSGAYAILLALYEKSLDPGYPGYLTKNEIIQYGQHLCDVSFTKPGPDTRYTGWSSMKTLLEKGLIHRERTLANFSLTVEGRTLADKLYVQHKVEEFQKQEQNQCDLDKCGTNVVPLLSTYEENVKNDVLLPQENHPPIWRQTSSTSTVSSAASYETVVFAPNSFEIILIVDTHELNGSKSDFEQDPLIRELKKLNVRHEVRNLKIGDYAWICRDNSNNELILPYIIERKRMDDFGKSIKDDRFHEQKFRLRNSGIQNIIYLIESYGKNEHVGLPIATLYQAAINTLIHDGFTVKFTSNGRSSCEYLACMTQFLEKLFKNKTLVSSSKDDLRHTTLDDDLLQLMRFQEFNKSSSKTRHFKVKEMFVRQLLQIKGMSVEKALAIVEKYKTPRALKLRYDSMGEAEAEKVLLNIQYGILKKNVGPVLSKIIYQLFCKKIY